MLFFLVFLQCSPHARTTSSTARPSRNREGRGRSRWRGANNRINRRAALAETAFVSHDKRQQVARILGSIIHPDLVTAKLCSLHLLIKIFIRFVQSPKAISRSVCAKACALVQAESAAFYLANHSAQELVLQVRHSVCVVSVSVAAAVSVSAASVSMAVSVFGMSQQWLSPFIWESWAMPQASSCTPSIHSWHNTTPLQEPCTSILSIHSL